MNQQMTPERRAELDRKYHDALLKLYATGSKAAFTKQEQEDFFTAWRILKALRYALYNDTAANHDNSNK